LWCRRADEEEEEVNDGGVGCHYYQWADWVGGEGWVALGHSNTEMEVDEKAAKREKEERELLVREEKTEGG